MKHSLAAFSSGTVVVVGDVMLDAYVMGDVPRLSPEAPVPIVRVSGRSATLGGAGNVALNVAGLTCRTVLLGIRGDDHAGERISDLLERHRIGDDLIVDRARSTTTKTRIIGHGQQLLRLDEEETDDGSEPIREHLLESFERASETADVVVLSDYNKGVLNDGMSREMITRCRSKRIPVLVDPKRQAWERYEGATCLTPNLSEVEQITGLGLGEDESLLADTASSLRERYGLDWFLVTRGSKGMCLVGQDGPPALITATAREVFDVSGAGDTVIATLAAAVATGWPVPDGAVLANTAAGVVVGKLGSYAISRAELEAALHAGTLGHGPAGRSALATLEGAQAQVRTWQAAGEQVVYTSGSFDLLHPGHIHLLHCAKALGDRLVVGVQADASVKRLRGPGRPRQSEQDRACVLSALECVDLMVMCHDDTPLRVIEALGPDVVARPTPGDSADASVLGALESYWESVRSVIVPGSDDEL